MSRLDTMARFEEPEIPDEIPMYFCDECGGEIYEGDEFYEIGDSIYCDKCINSAFKIAER
jgi:hypothetical protein